MSSTSSPLSHPLALRISLSATSPTSCAPARGMRRSGPERRRQVVLQREHEAARARQAGQEAPLLERTARGARGACGAQGAPPRAARHVRCGLEQPQAPARGPEEGLRRVGLRRKRAHPARARGAPPPRPEARAAPRPARAMQHLTAFYCRYAAEGAETEHGAPERGAKGLDASLHLRNASSSRKGFARQRALKACFAVAARRNVSRHARGTQSAAKGVDNTAHVPLDSGCPPKWRFSWHACGGTARAGDRPPCAR